MEENLKRLLLKVLCAMLPYGVKIQRYGDGLDDSAPFVLRYNNTELKPIIELGWKPYLRPMSSITEEEQIELGKLIGTASYNMLKGDMSHLDALLTHIYKNHIDVFGLIPQGLALEAPEGMYNIKEK